MLISRDITSLLMSFFHFCSFCHKCQKPLFYTLCLLRHRSLPYLCTACFALPRLRPFSFVLSACRLHRHAETPETRSFCFYKEYTAPPTLCAASSSDFVYAHSSSECILPPLIPRESTVGIPAMVVYAASLPP